MKVNMSVLCFGCELPWTDYIAVVVSPDNRVFPCPGRPLAPGELEVVGDTAHQLRLNWSSPFTLPGESVHYSLVIVDQVTGHTETVAPLTDTDYTHSVSESEALSCHPFLFSVSSVNDVGHSINSSSAPPAIHPSGQLTP